MITIITQLRTINYVHLQVMLLFITKEGSDLLGGFGHVHLKNKVGMRAKAQQAALLGAQLHQLLQDSRILLLDEPLQPKGQDTWIYFLNTHNMTD